MLEKVEIVRRSNALFTGVRLPFLFRLRDGLITRGEEYLDPAEALAATGLTTGTEEAAAPFRAPR
jgi:hypothetical protein